MAAAASELIPYLVVATVFKPLFHGIVQVPILLVSEQALEPDMNVKPVPVHAEEVAVAPLYPLPVYELHQEDDTHVA